MRKYTKKPINVYFIFMLSSLYKWTKRIMLYTSMMKNWNWAIFLSCFHLNSSIFWIASAWYTFVFLVLFKDEWNSMESWDPRSKLYLKIKAFRIIGSESFDSTCFKRSFSVSPCSSVNFLYSFLLLIRILFFLKYEGSLARIPKIGTDGCIS